MAVYSGNDGVVIFNSQTIGEVMSFTVNQNMETIDATAMGATWRTKLAGLQTWDGTVEVRWDPDDAGQTAAAIGSKFTLELYPEGNAATNEKISGTAFVTGTSQTQSYDNTTVTKTYTFEGESSLAITTVPNP